MRGSSPFGSLSLSLCRFKLPGRPHYRPCVSFPSATLRGEEETGNQKKYNEWDQDNDKTFFISFCCSVWSSDWFTNLTQKYFIYYFIILFTNKFCDIWCTFQFQSKKANNPCHDVYRILSRAIKTTCRIFVFMRLAPLFVGVLVSDSCFVRGGEATADLTWLGSALLVVGLRLGGS